MTKLVEYEKALVYDAFGSGSCGAMRKAEDEERFVPT